MTKEEKDYEDAGRKREYGYNHPTQVEDYEEEE